jgi:uncharacterized protein VirK/YbjX
MSRTHRHQGIVDKAVASCPWVWPTLDCHPILFRPLTSGFLDARLSYQRRVEVFAHDLRFTSTHVQRAFPGFFPNDLQAHLWVDTTQHYALVLDLNLDHPQEGLWRLSLRGAGERIFSVCFSILPGPEIFIGGVQGGRSTASASMVDSIRAATKAFEGIRPHFLLVDVIRTLAAAWEVNAIRGISSRLQLKGRSRGRGPAAVKFSYDEFFQDLGGIGTVDGLWTIPTSTADRDIADAPSRKRAMYRRRSGLLDQLRGTVRSKLKASGGFLGFQLSRDTMFKRREVVSLSYNPQLGLCDDALDEGISRAQSAVDFGSRIQRWIYSSLQAMRGRLQGCK